MRLLLLLIATVAITGCPEPDDDFWRDPSEPTPTPTPEPDPDARIAELEFDRVRDESGDVDTRVRASFHEPVNQPLRPSVPSGLDDCEAGKAANTAFDLPASTMDIGELILMTEDGEESLTFDGTYWSGYLPNSAWIPNEEIGFRVTGGEDLAGQIWADQLGTPARLELDVAEATDDGIQLQWTGSNSDGHVELLIATAPADELIWVACKLFDDGEELILWEDLAGVGPGEARLELRRETSTVFAVDDGEGNATGASRVIRSFDLPEVAADDDDSAGQ